MRSRIRAANRAVGGRVRPRSGLFSAILAVRSLREAAEDAQPLLGTSAGTRGHWSQPRACHEDHGGRFCSRTAILGASQRPPGVRVCHRAWARRPGAPPGTVLTIGLLPSSAPCEARRSMTAQPAFRATRRSASAAVCAAATTTRSQLHADDLRPAQHLSAHAVRAGDLQRGTARSSARAGRSRSPSCGCSTSRCRALPTRSCMTS